MSFPVEVCDLTVRFGDTRAVDDVSFSLAGGAIVGLLGRNGAGKTTLLETLAAFRRPTSGGVLIDGEDPYENRRLMSEMCLVREDGDLDDGVCVRDAMKIAATLRPRWDEETALRLVDRFEIATARKVGALSRGQRSALAASIGIATRAPVTMLDEPHLGGVDVWFLTDGFDRPNLALAVAAATAVVAAAVWVARRMTRDTPVR